MHTFIEDILIDEESCNQPGVPKLSFGKSITDNIRTTEKAKRILTDNFFLIPS